MEIAVLIVEDNQEKLANIIKLFEAQGILRNNIDVAQTGIEARKYLKDKEYTLMLLDVALPYRPEDTPNETGGIELLNEVIEREVYNMPLHIVGLTAHESLFHDLYDYFSEKTLTFLYYDRTVDSWNEKIKSCIRLILQASNNSPKKKYHKDLCIITALEDPELKAILALPWNWSNPINLDDASYYYEGSFISNNKTYSVVAANCSRPGMVSAAIQTSKMITKFVPRIVAMAGICGGLKNECELGDIILANPVWNWQSGKIISGNTGALFSIEPHHLDINPALTNRFKQLSLDDTLFSQIRKDWPAQPPKTIINAHVGPIACGSSVLANNDAVKDIQNQHRKVIGIEMEIYGVYSAVHEASTPKPLGLAMKAVCDFADEDKNDSVQPYAAYVSAQILMNYMERYMEELSNIITI